MPPQLTTKMFETLTFPSTTCRPSYHIALLFVYSQTERTLDIPRNTTCPSVIRAGNTPSMKGLLPKKRSELGLSPPVLVTVCYGGKGVLGQVRNKDRGVEGKREQTFNRCSFFLLFSAFPVVRLLFRSSQLLTFGLQLRSPAGAFLDDHHYKFSEYSLGTGRTRNV